MCAIVALCSNDICRSTCTTDGTTPFVRQVRDILAVNKNIVGFNVHHTKIENTLPALRAVRDAGWTGPLGAYPDHGEHTFANAACCMVLQTKKCMLACPCRGVAADDVVSTHSSMLHAAWSYKLKNTCWPVLVGNTSH